MPMLTDTSKRKNKSKGQGQLWTIEPTSCVVVLSYCERLPTQTEDETPNKAHVVLLYLDAHREYRLAQQDQPTEQYRLYQPSSLV